MESSVEAVGIVQVGNDGAWEQSGCNEKVKKWLGSGYFVNLDQFYHEVFPRK